MVFRFTTKLPVSGACVCWRICVSCYSARVFLNQTGCALPAFIRSVVCGTLPFQREALARAKTSVPPLTRLYSPKISRSVSVSTTAGNSKNIIILLSTTYFKNTRTGADFSHSAFCTAEDIRCAST